MFPVSFLRLKVITNFSLLTSTTLPAAKIMLSVIVVALKIQLQIVDKIQLPADKY